MMCKAIWRGGTTISIQGSGGEFSSVLFNTMHIARVTDSRAIICWTTDSNSACKPLSVAGSAGSTPPPIVSGESTHLANVTTWGNASQADIAGFSNTRAVFCYRGSNVNGGSADVGICKLITWVSESQPVSVVEGSGSGAAFVGGGNPDQIAVASYSSTKGVVCWASEEVGGG